MKILPRYSWSILWLGLTVSTFFLSVRPASANPVPTINQVEQIEAQKSANQLGGAQGIRQGGLAAERSKKDMPVFEVKGKSSRPRGVLGVLGGRFNDLDRHPSFRKLEQQR